jgi:hypothetical protein
MNPSDLVCIGWMVATQSTRAFMLIITAFGDDVVGDGGVGLDA